MKSIAFASTVRKEVDDAADFYSTRGEKLPDRFLKSLERTYQRILAQPLLFGFIDGENRAAPVPRFPFLVVYRNRRKRIEIISVYHVRLGSFPWRRASKKR